MREWARRTPSQRVRYSLPPRPGAAHHRDQRRERQIKAAEAFSAALYMGILTDIGQSVQRLAVGRAPSVVVAGCYGSGAVAIATARDSWSRTLPAPRTPQGAGATAAAARTAGAERLPTARLLPTATGERSPPDGRLAATGLSSSSQRACAPTGRRPAAGRRRPGWARVVAAAPSASGAPTRSAADTR